jgi:hypothetical protein
MMPIELHEPISLDDLRKAIERFTGYPVETLKAHHRAGVVRAVYKDGEHLDFHVRADLRVEDRKVIATLGLEVVDDWTWEEIEERKVLKL